MKQYLDLIEENVATSAAEPNQPTPGTSVPKENIPKGFYNYLSGQLLKK